MMSNSFVMLFWDRLLIALLGILLLSGCSPTQAVRYYQISPLPTAEADPEQKKADAPTIGLGPVLLPEYLNRSQIVTRTSPNQLVLADGHRWAEPLTDNVMRVLSDNLSFLLGRGQILSYPWPRNRKIDFQVVIEVLEFEGGADGRAILDARWSVLAGDGRMLLPEKRSSISALIAGPDHEALVAALSEALGGLSRAIVTGLTPLMEL